MGHGAYEEMPRHAMGMAGLLSFSRLDERGFRVLLACFCWFQLIFPRKVRGRSAEDVRKPALMFEVPGGQGASWQNGHRGSRVIIIIIIITIIIIINIIIIYIYLSLSLYIYIYIYTYIYIYVRIYIYIYDI